MTRVEAAPSHVGGEKILRPVQHLRLPGAHSALQEVQVSPVRRPPSPTHELSLNEPADALERTLPKLREGSEVTNSMAVGLRRPKTPGSMEESPPLQETAGIGSSGSGSPVRNRPEVYDIGDGGSGAASPRRPIAEAEVYDISDGGSGATSPRRSSLRQELDEHDEAELALPVQPKLPFVPEQSKLSSEEEEALELPEQPSLTHCITACTGGSGSEAGSPGALAGAPLPEALPEALPAEESKQCDAQGLPVGISADQLAFLVEMLPKLARRVEELERKVEAQEGSGIEKPVPGCGAEADSSDVVIPVAAAARAAQQDAEVKKVQVVVAAAAARFDKQLREVEQEVHQLREEALASRPEETAELKRLQAVVGSAGLAFSREMGEVREHLGQVRQEVLEVKEQLSDLVSGGSAGPQEPSSS